MTRNVLDSAAADFETLKSRRIATLDLERASLDANRDKFEAFITDRVAEAVVSSHPDRYRALWQSLLIEADRRFAWQPSPLPARPISLEPSNDVTARRAARGRAEDLLYLFADWDLGPEVLRDWQPPPPIHS